MTIPCKECLVLAMCKSKDEIDCDKLESYFVRLRLSYNSSFDKIHEILPRVYRITGNGLIFNN